MDPTRTLRRRFLKPPPRKNAGQLEPSSLMSHAHLLNMEAITKIDAH